MEPVNFAVISGTMKNTHISGQYLKYEPKEGFIKTFLFDSFIDWHLLVH